MNEKGVGRCFRYFTGLSIVDCRYGADFSAMSYNLQFFRIVDCRLSLRCGSALATTVIIICDILLFIKYQAFSGGGLK